MTDTDGDGGRSPGPTPGERLNARLANGKPFTSSGWLNRMRW